MKETYPFEGKKRLTYIYIYIYIYIFRFVGEQSIKSRNTWSNRQIWPWSTEWSRAKANRVLPREHTGHSKHPLPNTREDFTHGHHQMVNTKIRLIIFFKSNMEKLYTVSKNKTSSWLCLRSWTPYCQNRLKLKKVGKTTRPFRYDLNPIPYDYTSEVRNRFKGLDLIDRVPDELWMEVHDTV